MYKHLQMFSLAWRKVWVYVGQIHFSLSGNLLGLVWGGGKVIRFFFITLCASPSCPIGLWGHMRL